MTLAYDLYKGTARNKRKANVVGEMSQPASKKTKVTKQVAETYEATPEVEVTETSRHRAASPPVEVIEESQVDVPSVSSPVEEPTVGSTCKEAGQELFDSVARMTIERVENVLKNKKYLKALSSF